MTELTASAFSLLVLAVLVLLLIACTAIFVVDRRALSDRQLQTVLEHYAKNNPQGNLIWHFSNLSADHTLRRNEFWATTTQVIGSVLIVAVIAILLIFKVIAAEAGLPILSAVSGFGLAKSSTLNRSENVAKE